MVYSLCYLQTQQDDRQRLVGWLKLVEPSQLFFSGSRVDIQNHGSRRTNVPYFVFQGAHDDHLIPALSEYFLENRPQHDIGLNQKNWSNHVVVLPVFHGSVMEIEQIRCPTAFSCRVPYKAAKDSRFSYDGRCCEMKVVENDSAKSETTYSGADILSRIAIEQGNLRDYHRAC